MTPLDPAPAPDWTRFAASLSSRLLNLSFEDTDAGLEAVLGELATRVGAHRALVLRVTPDDRIASRSHLWCLRPDETPKVGGQHLMTAFPYLRRASEQGEVVAWGSPEDVPPEAAAEWRSLVAVDGFRALLLIPMSVRHRFFGVLALRGPLDASVHWPTALIEHGRLLADAIAALLARTAIEDQLRRRETRYRTLGRLHGDAVQVLDEGGACTFASAGASDLQALGGDAALGGRLIDRVDSADRPRFEGAFQAALADPSVDPAEAVRVRLDDARYAPVEVRFHNRLRTPGIEGVVVTLRDLRPLREAERQSARQSALLDAVGQPVLAADMDRIVTYWNPAAERLTGWTAADVLGRRADALGLWGDAPAISAAIEDAVLAGRPWSGELQVRHGFRAPIRVRATVSPLPDLDGRLTGTVTVLTDLRPFDRLARSAAQHDRLDALSRLAEDIVHDLGNGLTALATRASLLGGLVRGEARTHLEGVEAAVRSLTATARDLEALADDGPVAPAPQPVNPALMELRRVLGRLLGDDVELVVRLAPDLPPVWATPRLLARVIVGLTATALGGVRQDGRLGLASELREAEPAVLVTLRFPGSPLPPRSIVEAGYVALVEAVQRVGGELEALTESAGVVGWQIALRTARRPPPTPARPGVALVVTPDAQQRARAVAALRAAHMVVVDAVSGTDARERQHVEPIDLLVVAVELADQSGVALAIELARSHPALRVVLLADGEPGRLAVDLQLGYTPQVLIQPWTDADLVAAARRGLHPSP